MKRKRKKHKSIIIPILIITISLLGILYSSYNIFIWKKNTLKNNEIKNQTNKYVEIKKDTYNIDFKSLKKINNDVIAYIKVNNTNIDYVIVKGNDNNYYLDHNLNREYNIAGWIYADYRNKFDGTDKNIIIYGHNMKDSTMFGTLQNTLNKNWQDNKDNLIITLITEENTYKYEVFSTYVIEPEDYYLNLDFNSDDDYLKFLNTLIKRSNNNYNIDINTNDKILTLSSCSNDGKKRIVLHSKLI